MLKKLLRLNDLMFYSQRAFKQIVVGAALAASCSTAWALPAFTFNPSADGMNGSAFTADNVLISDFSSVTFSDPTHFTDTGLLQVTSFQLGGNTFTPTGLNAAGGYSLWFSFTGTGHLTSGTASTLSSAPSN